MMLLFASTIKLAGRISGRFLSPRVLHTASRLSGQFLKLATKVDFLSSQMRLNSIESSINDSGGIEEKTVRAIVVE